METLDPGHGRVDGGDQRELLLRVRGLRDPSQGLRVHDVGKASCVTEMSDPGLPVMARPADEAVLEELAEVRVLLNQRELQVGSLGREESKGLCETYKEVV